MKKIYPLLFLLCCVLSAQAQLKTERDVVASSGDHYSNGDLSVTWTLGETITETYSNGALIVCQGFHQDDKLVSSTQENKLPFPVSVFPNPTSATLHIKTGQPEKLTAALFDVSGKLIIEQLLNEHTSINSMDLHNLPEATYFLRVADEEGRNTTFKIQKITTQ